MLTRLEGKITTFQSTMNVFFPVNARFRKWSSLYYTTSSTIHHNCTHESRMSSICMANAIILQIQLETSLFQITKSIYKFQALFNTITNSQHNENTTLKIRLLFYWLSPTLLLQFLFLYIFITSCFHWCNCLEDLNSWSMKIYRWCWVPLNGCDDLICALLVCPDPVMQHLE